MKYDNLQECMSISKDLGIGRILLIPRMENEALSHLEFMKSGRWRKKFFIDTRFRMSYPKFSGSHSVRRFQCSVDIIYISPFHRKHLENSFGVLEKQKWANRIETKIIKELFLMMKGKYNSVACSKIIDEFQNLSRIACKMSY